MIAFIIYSMFGVILYSYFYIYTKDALNPFSVSIGGLIVTFGLCQLDFNSYQTGVSVWTHLAVLLVVAELTVVGIVVLSNYRPCDKRQPVITDQFHNCAWGLLFVVCIVVIYILSGNGFNTDFANRDYIYDAKGDLNVYEGAGWLAYIAYLIPYIPIYFVFLIIYSKRLSKFKYILYCTISVMALIYIWKVLVSRGTLLTTVLGIYYLMNNRFNFSIKKVLLSLFSIIFVAGILMEARVDSRSLVYYGSFNPILNSTYNYIVFCYENLDKLIVHGSPFTVITSVWVSLSKAIGIYDSEAIIGYQTYMYNAKTFLYYFFHDLSWLGLIIYPVAIYIIVGKIYVRSKTDKPEYSLFMAAIYKAIAVPFFGNYFFGKFSMDVAYCVTVILIYFSYKNRFKFVLRK